MVCERAGSGSIASEGGRCWGFGAGMWAQRATGDIGCCLESGAVRRTACRNVVGGRSHSMSEVTRGITSPGVGQLSLKGQ